MGRLRNQSGAGRGSAGREETKRQRKKEHSLAKLLAFLKPGYKKLESQAVRPNSLCQLPAQDVLAELAQLCASLGLNRPRPPRHASPRAAPRRATQRSLEADRISRSAAL